METATENLAHAPREDLVWLARLLLELAQERFLGSRRLTAWLIGQGERVNRKRVQRLLRLMGLEAIYSKPRLSAIRAGHRVYPYLLRNVSIERPDQVWSTDITYVPLASGFMYLAAILDWYSRDVIAWRLSNTLDGSFFLEMLEEALKRGRPEVFNTDQGGAVHGSSVDRAAGVGGSPGEHGWAGPLPGQRVRGAAMADSQVRGHLPVAARGGAAVAAGAGAVLPL
jgi:transposase InsO family protein